MCRASGLPDQRCLSSLSFQDIEDTVPSVKRRKREETKKKGNTIQPPFPTAIKPKLQTQVFTAEKVRGGERKGLHANLTLKRPILKFITWQPIGPFADREMHIQGEDG